MTLTKAPKHIKVRVPRHNAQLIGAKLGAEIRNQAKAKSIRADTAQPNSELVQAIESASEWNSLLMTARAERGPQWDVGTQQFLVDEYSDLYYDCTPLFEAVKKVKEEEQITEQQQHQQQQQSHHPHHQQQYHPSMGSRHQTPMRDRDYHSQMGGPEPSPHRHSGPPGGFPYPASPSMNIRPGSGYGNVGGGAPFNSISQQQFYSGNSAPSPMRMGSMGNISMDDHGMGGHHGMGGMGLGGGMQGMPAGGSPDVRRRMTRGMAEEGYPMH